MRPWIWMIAVIGSIVCATAVQAQPRAVQRLERQLQAAEEQYMLRASPGLSVGERSVIDYGALANFSFMAVDDTGGETHMLRQTDVRAWARLSVDGVHEAFGRLHYLYRDFNSADSFDGRGDEQIQPLADRYWYKFDLRRAIEAYEGRSVDYNATIQVGRQFVDWAGGLTLSDQLYAARGTIEWRDLEFEGLAGWTPSGSFIDIDASRPDFDRNETHRRFLGAKLTYKGLRGHRPYFYVLDQHDENHRNFATLMVGGFPFPTKFRYESTYWAIGSTGLILPRLVYSAELVYQSGNSFSDSSRGVPQTNDEISAWAGKAGLSYVMRDQNLSRIDFETIVASGDDDRLLDTTTTFGGNTPGTKDHAFNAFGYANTGLAFGAPLSNLIMFRVGGSTFPLRSVELFRELRVGADVLFFNKYNKSAPLDQATDNQRFLGFETDLYADWRITSDVTVNLRYGVFFPGSAISPDDDERHFFYTGVTYSF